MARKPKSKPAKSAANTKASANLEPYKWQPGQSGNPNGRPRVVGELRDLAREKTSIAMATLIEVCSSKDAPPAARVAAAAHILDRGYGKPTQHVSQTVRHVKQMTDDELFAYLTGAEQEDGGDGAFAPESDPGKPH